MGWLSELEDEARALLPRDTYDFLAGGSGEEDTLAANERAWREMYLRPRVLRDVSRVETSTTLLGSRVSSPVAVAPAGYHHLVNAEAEVATARGAAAAGSLLVLSSRCSRRIEDIAAVAGPWWFQSYMLRQRSLTVQLARRAAECGAAALVLTADAPVLSRRRRSRDADFIAAEFFQVNLGPLAVGEHGEQSPAATVAEIGRLTAETGLPVVVKGVLRGDEARRCVDAGAAAVWVSNHGGRQLDGAVPTAWALAEVVAAVGDDVEVYVDGGVRSGVDVLRALCLGVRGVLVARPAIWGLAVAGSDGVRDVLGGLHEELRTAMALAGAANLGELTADLIAGSTAAPGSPAPPVGSGSTEYPADLG